MNIPMTTAEPVLDIQAVLAVGPGWDARTQLLHFVDIIAGRINTLDSLTGAVRATATGAMVGCVALRKSGGLVVALADGIWRVALDSGRRPFLTALQGHDATRLLFQPKLRDWADWQTRK